FFGVDDVFDPRDAYVTSPFFGPGILAGLRLTIAFYIFLTLLFMIIWDGVKLHSDNSYFSYFTQLTNIGLCSYFWASGVQTFFFAKSGGTRYPLKQSWPKFLRLLHVLLISTICTFPFIVTVVFWIFLSSDFDTSVYSTWSNISVHAFDVVWALFEILFTNILPLPWVNLIVCVILLALYLALAYVTYATQGFYTYSFLDPSNGPILAAYIVGIAVAECILFLVVRSIIIVRRRRFGKPSLHAAGSTRELAVMEETSHGPNSMVSIVAKDHCSSKETQPA
ncbi:hypothetical protein FISHEDRAFT_53069, partial [Fistulina hepatica ATCC 64428]